MDRYFGSKATSGLCQPIIAMMPPHDTYIETHLGGGAVMQRKPPALRNIAIDLDPKPLKVFQCDYPVEKFMAVHTSFFPPMPIVDVNWFTATLPIFTTPAAQLDDIVLTMRSRIILSCWRSSRGCPVRLSYPAIRLMSTMNC